MPSYMPDRRRHRELTEWEVARLEQEARICAAIDELRKTCEIDDVRDVLRARVRKVTVLQPNPRYL
jgi:hypothetical protein